MKMKATKMKITMLLSVALAGGVLAAPAWSDYPRVPGITYADQPTGIELSVISRPGRRSSPTSSACEHRNATR
jgi:hypothetical protein